MAGYTGGAGTPGTHSVFGVVAGSVLRRVREDLGLSQVDLADRLRVDSNTLKGWETGRRPLANTKAATLRGVARQLRVLGTADQMLRRLDYAVDVDITLGLITQWEVHDDPLTHPLATTVTDREWHDLLSPALRGPRPLLPATDRAQIFGGLRTVTEVAQGTDNPAAVLLRRQCAYMLAAWDPQSEDWLTQTWRRELRLPLDRSDWSPTWVAHRSFAVGRAVAGDIDELRRFIAERLAGNDRLEAANLNYWAYWIGETGHPGSARSDDFMATPQLGDWRGTALIQHLSSRLLAVTPHLELTIHSLWALVTYRPRLLAERPDIAGELSTRCTLLLDSKERNNLGARALQEIDQMHYATRLARGMTR